MNAAAWLFVAIALVLLVFVGASCLALRGVDAADRVANVGFWAACGVAVLLMGWLMIDRGLT